MARHGSTVAPGRAYPVEPGQKRTLLDGLIRRRNRLLSTPAFGRWAASFPLTRYIARKRARALFDLCGGFVYTQVLLACVRLKLFDLLSDDFKTVDQIATHTSLSTSATTRLITAAVSLRLVERRGKDRYGLGPLGAAMLANPSLTMMVEHHALLYGDLHDPVSLLRGVKPENKLGPYWPYAQSDDPAALEDGKIRAYTALMSASQSMITAEVLRTVSIRRTKVWMDVGGGDGTFVAAAADKSPDTAFILFDLPAVAARAAKRFDQAGIADRTQAIGGNFLKDPLPAGADVISLVRIVHDHDDAAVKALLRNVRNALSAGGTIIVAEPMSGTPGAEPIGDAYFGFYLLAMGSGRARTHQEISALLVDAGFSTPKLLHTHLPLVTRVIRARVA